MFTLRSRLSSVLATLCAITSLLDSTAFAQNFDKAEIKTEKLSPTTYMMVGAGGNLGVSIGDDAVFVIDDQYAPMTPKITAAIKALTDKPVQFVLNTHWHGDHTGGNENFSKAGSLIVAHENVRKRLSTDQFIQLFKMQALASPKAALPVVTFTSDLTFHLNGDEIFVFHVPKAHTDGDAIVHFRNSNVIHMGDTYFNGFYPFIDSSSGGTPDGVIAASDRVLALADDKTRIIPGHGPVSTKADLKVYRDVIATVNGRVKALMKEGKKLQDILAATPSAEFDEKWGKSFISPGRFVEMLVIAQTPATAPVPAPAPATAPAAK
ncbi:MAG: MBL fold metallo-hydrolase [Betaproteobacteria bacterium]|nr:MBL fold metallo-hydrolase [Betaproteobacteria bacterium]